MRADSNASTLLRLLLLSLLLAAAPAWAQKKADLSRLVVVGDSLSAGYQNGSLLDTQQPHGYAKVLADQARTSLAALVDVHEILGRIAKRGFAVNGQRLTTEFLGGLFSLDGVHPTNTGYAVIANEFIRALNRDFAAGIPPVSVEQVAKQDPLVLPEAGRPPRKEHISADTARALRSMMGHGRR